MITDVIGDLFFFYSYAFLLFYEFLYIKTSKLHL